MTTSYLIQVGETWIASRKKRNSRHFYLMPCHTKELASRFNESDAERVAGDLRKREELFSRWGERKAEPVVIHAVKDEKISAFR